MGYGSGSGRRSKLPGRLGSRGADCIYISIEVLVPGERGGRAVRLVIEGLCEFLVLPGIFGCVEPDHCMSACIIGAIKMYVSYPSSTGVMAWSSLP